jgi:uncharacterized integral membrane protein
MRLGRRRSDEEPVEHAEAEAPEATEAPPPREREWQPRLWLKLGILLATIAYVVAFVLENRKQVHLHFVFGRYRVSLIWLILLSLGLGLLGGVLLSQLYRRRRRRH